MIANVVKIGNSHYVLLAKKWLDSSGISDRVEIEYREGSVIIKPFRNPREGWSALYEESFANDGWEEPLLPGEFGEEQLPDYGD